ncbi:hypothetical protein M407DRAFT_242344 [Tulasnella calospora MUT 4182]|uniref:Uncharacterized protein n=1 Tax=Tulasnella calospora MUT 4182 TaxID=1051891 RepID=A0A0C3M8X2_9AGAM|nr:hypothetical protein M407DRAFT_242344 [Tulasnella calospora MUT 4182]
MSRPSLGVRQLPEGKADLYGLVRACTGLYGLRASSLLRCGNIGRLSLLKSK